MASEPQTIEHKRAPRIVRFVRDISAIAIWAAVIVKSFIFDFDIYLIQRFAPEYNWFLPYKAFFSLAVLIVIALLASQRWFRKRIIYVVCFPLLVLLQLAFYLVFFHWGLLLVFAPAIHSFVANLRRVFIWLSLSIIAAFLISISSNTNVLVVSAGLIVTYLIQLYFNQVSSAFRASSTFSDLTSVVRKTRDFVLRKTTAKQVAKLTTLLPDSPEYEKACTATLSSIYLTSCGFQIVAIQLEKLLKSRKLDLYYVASFAFTYIVTVLGFAFIYSAAHKIAPDQFTPADTSFFDLLGLSFSTFAANNISGVELFGPLSRGLGYLQMVFLVILVVIFFGFVVNCVRERHREDFGKLIQEFALGQQAIEAELGSAHDLTFDALETLLVDSSRELVNMMRTARGEQKLIVIETPIES